MWNNHVESRLHSLFPHVLREQQETFYSCWLSASELATVTHALFKFTVMCSMLGCSWRLFGNHSWFKIRLPTSRFHHVYDYFQELHQLPVVSRAQYKLLVIICKAQNFLGPGNLKDHLTVLMSWKPSWLPREDLLHTPQISEVQLVGMRERALYLAAPQLDVPPDRGPSSPYSLNLL